MHWIDGHLDLAYIAECGRDPRREPTADEAASGCVSLPALRRAEVRTVFATIFTEPGQADPAKPFMYPPDDVDAAETAGLRQLAIYQQWHAEGEIEMIGADQTGILIDAAGRNLKRKSTAAKSKPPLRLILLMEGADPIRAPEHVPRWHQRGLRVVGLTWATGTRYAGGNSSAPGSGPLTPMGVEMVRALDEVGIIHDVSHLSDAAFDGLTERASPASRIIASHSNCRALVENKQRHLRDEQIMIIGERGGVIGLNLYTDFLFPRAGPGRAGGRRAVIADCVAHLEHVSQIMGHRRGVALGSDMDGGFGPEHLPIGLDHPAKLPALAEALRDAGWSDEEIEGFAHGNWERVICSR